jgi:PAS domain S-box-containing protein
VRKGAVAGAFWAAIAVLLALGVATLLTVSKLLGSFAWVAHTERVLDALSGLREAVLESTASRRGYAFTGREEELASYAAGVARMRARVEDARRLTADNPVQQRRLAELASVVEARIQSMDRAIEARRKNPSDLDTQSRLIVEGEALRKEMERRIAEISADEELLASARRASLTRSSILTRAAVVAAGLTCLALLVVTYHLLRKETLSRERAQLELDRFFSVSLDLMCIAREGSFVRVNPAWERTLGWPAAELVGKPYLDYVHPADREDTTAASARLGEGKEIVGFTNRYRARDGSWRWLEWIAVPDLPSGVVYAAARDVSEQRRARTELENANHELEAFSYSVSHDLRAPLRGIDGFVQALAEDYAPSLDERAKDYVSRIRNATRKMSGLIDALLALSRVSRAELRKESVDLSLLGRAIAAELARLDPARRVEVSVQEGLSAQGDSRLLRAALENLLANAWKFTAKTPEPRIELFANGAPGGVVFHVRDNGAGFEMAYASKLFGAFQRLHGVTEFPGTGVGLATVQRIVHRHGGRVWAEGETGKGATFSFTLGGTERS